MTDEIQTQLNGFGVRLNTTEQKVATLDERSRNAEKQVEGIHKAVIGLQWKLIFIIGGIVAVSQFVDKVLK